MQERLNTSDKCLKKEHEENNALRYVYPAVVYTPNAFIINRKELQEIEKESAEFKRENKRERYKIILTEFLFDH